jgi:hypothetical protein
MVQSTSNPDFMSLASFANAYDVLTEDEPDLLQDNNNWIPLPRRPRRRDISKDHDWSLSHNYHNADHLQEFHSQILGALRPFTNPFEYSHRHWPAISKLDGLG